MHSCITFNDCFMLKLGVFWPSVASHWFSKIFSCSSLAVASRIHQLLWCKLVLGKMGEMGWLIGSLQYSLGLVVWGGVSRLKMKTMFKLFTLIIDPERNRPSWKPLRLSNVLRTTSHPFQEDFDAASISSFRGGFPQGWIMAWHTWHKPWQKWVFPLHCQVCLQAVESDSRYWFILTQRKVPGVERQVFVEP